MRFLCVHCHFYQPPRENPWLEQIELQDSAYPYHDWNERITSECYARNAAARILDPEDRIDRIVNLYGQISFNYGPTLLSWMRDKSPVTYEAILHGDAQGRERFGGHGSAIAQCYNHMIMPLASAKDKRTQVLWGIQDFRRRFDRMPEGMWLPETAVDLETLSILAAEGIKFTILAPSQAKSFREIGAKVWKDTSGASIDPKRAYRVNTSAGPINMFFYDGPVSRAVAFERLLDNGVKFAERLLGGFSNDHDTPQLMHIATDGETYGHHHKFGEMALAYALHHIESNNLARITNYGEYLELNPPKHEAEILENTAWSCIHGVGRWSRDCGCNAGGGPGWNQGWREPLRAALDWLRDHLAPLYERHAVGILRDPWAARDAYVSVVLDRSAESRQRFGNEHFAAELSAEDNVKAWKLLEMQRHLMLMYTSCGWFFDEVSGIETVQVIEYAARAVQLAEESFERRFEKQFLTRLARAKSNLVEQGDGASIYRLRVKPAMADLAKVGAHYAVSSIFERYPERAYIYCYDIEREQCKEAEFGTILLAVGKARITSRITAESALVQYAVMYFGDQNIHAHAGKFANQKSFEELSTSLFGAFRSSDLGAVIRAMDRGFRSEVSLQSLFKDAQRKIAGQILAPAIEEAAIAYKRLYRHHAPLLRMLHELRIPDPTALRDAAAHALNGMLNEALQTAPLDIELVRKLLDEANMAGVQLDGTVLELTLRDTINQRASLFFGRIDDVAAFEELVEAVTLSRSLPFPVSLWSLQNRCYQLRETKVAEYKQRASHDAAAAAWLDAFRRLSEGLRLRLK